MAIQRMDHVGVVVTDLGAAIAFVRTPDGHSQLELTGFHRPEAVDGASNAPANALGIRHLTFAVDDLDDVLERLRPHGAELVGEVEQYADIFRLCFVRGPDGIILELAQPLR
jgi:catechol 2,3-dioxygenase-like lactoylglutathione lyase family enzyme